MRIFPILTFLFVGGLGSAAALELPVRKEVLPNGLTVLLYENRQAPTVACRLFYATGSVHEAPGHSGLAHMLEHMLFKGTKKVGITDSVADARLLASQDSLQALMRAADLRGDKAALPSLRTRHDSLLQEHRKLFIKDELWTTYQEAGGTNLNAFTTDLMTGYHVTLPKNKVELFLWLESDRMQNAVLREFYPERDVVREERRMRTDDRPTGRYGETLESMIYEAFPYRIPTIGWASDIEHLTREQAEEHYRKYYKPRNAILVFTGDFTADSLLPLIRKYFGPVPTGEAFPPLTLQEPEQVGEKRFTVWRNDAKPTLDMVFKTPAVGHADLYALDIAEGTLNGRAGRLYKRLVEKEQLCVSVSAGNSPNKYLSTFSISATLRPGVDPAKVEAIIWEELRLLQNEAVSPRDFQKVRNNTYATQVRSLTDMENVASMLAWYEVFGDYRIFITWAERVDQVKPADVQAAAKAYFQRKNVVVGILLPETGAQP
jgi:predicted Zn-dependent peptidase